MRRWWSLAAVAALLMAAGVAASTVSLGLSDMELPESNEGPGDPVSPPPPPPTREPAPRENTQLEVPEWVMWGLLAVGVAVVALVVAYFLRQLSGSGGRFRRRRIARPEAAPKKTVAEEVVAAVEASLLELDETVTDPRRAVIACWVRLERAAAAVGTPREPGDTSTDLVLRLLSTHRLSREVLTSFADVYRQARYAARHEVDESMRSMARAALTRLRGELTVAAEAAV